MDTPKAPKEHTRPCPTCQSEMTWTGLPDCSGPIYVRFYKCPKCGIVKVNVSEERTIGWG